MNHHPCQKADCCLAKHSDHSSPPLLLQATDGIWTTIPVRKDDCYLAQHSDHGSLILDIQPDLVSLSNWPSIASVSFRGLLLDIQPDLVSLSNWPSTASEVWYYILYRPTLFHFQTDPVQLQRSVTRYTARPCFTFKLTQYSFSKLQRFVTGYTAQPCLTFKLT